MLRDQLNYQGRRIPGRPKEDGATYSLIKSGGTAYKEEEEYTNPVKKLIERHTEVEVRSQQIQKTRYLIVEMSKIQ